MNLRALLGRETTMRELQTMVDGLSSSVSSRRERARVQQSITASLVKLVVKEAVEFEKPTTYALDPYRQIAATELDFANLEERVKDDLQDIIERYKVIQRIDAQYGELLSQVQAAKAALTQAELTLSTVNSELGPRRQKAEQELARAKTAKADLIVKARDLTVQLIEAKERFNKFRLNRLRHAWVTYADALSQYGKQGAELYGVLAKGFAEMRGRLIEPPTSPGDGNGHEREATDARASPGAAPLPVRAPIQNPFEGAD
jgi:multidrug efflux pump subunit AcrA (membrane-fusion protein)